MTCSFWVVIAPTSTRKCLSYKTVPMEVLKLTPPFTYSYQCGSTLLTSYIPVYMYIVMIQILVDISRVIIILNINYENYPKLIRYWFPNKHMKSSKIISNVMNNLVLLLSFGLSSPILCFCLCLGMIVSEKCKLILIGKKFFETINGNNEHLIGINDGKFESFFCYF